MSNVLSKNKALVWMLIFVFLFTSVFNTGIAFAGTNDGVASAAYATDPNATDPNATDPNATDPNATDPNASDPDAGYYTDYTFYARGGTFADGSASKVFTLNLWANNPMKKVEKPTREGYVFAGWRDSDGCSVTHPYDACSNKIYAKWRSLSDATIKLGRVEYIVGEVDPDEYVDYDYDKNIWQKDTVATVTLPFNVNKDYVRLYVKKKDGATDFKDIELKEGTTIVTYDSVSPDGTGTKTYTVKIKVEEPPVELYNASVVFYCTEDDYDYEETVDVAFDEGEASVTLPSYFNTDKEIVLQARDIDGSRIESEGVVMGDAETALLTYTSAVNGATYKVTVKKTKPVDNFGFDVRVRYTSEDYINKTWYGEPDKDGNINIVIDYVAFLDLERVEDSRLLLYVSPYSSSTAVDMTWNEDRWEYEEQLYPENNKATRTFTLTAKSGNTKTYTVTVTPDAGDEPELKDMYATYMCDDDSEDSAHKEYAYPEDLEAAGTEKGAVCEISRYAVVSEGIKIPYIGGDYSEIEGLKDVYYFDENGECVVEFGLRSPNGQVVKNYKITFIIDPGTTEPYETYAYYYDKDGTYHSSNLWFEDNYAEVQIYSGYDAERGLTIAGCDINDEFFKKTFTDFDGNDLLQFVSLNGQTYTVSPVFLPVNNDISCSVSIWTTDGSNSKRIYADMREAYETGQTTVVVPYGTITDTDGEDDNILRMGVDPGSDTSTVDVEYFYGADGSGYLEELTPDENGDYSRTITVTAESGATRAYRINIVEEPGTALDVDYIQVYCKEGGYLSQIEFNRNELFAKGEITVKVPRNYDKKEGLHFSYDGGLCKIRGLDEKVKLDATGKATVEFEIVSPNGKIIQPYTINFVLDEDEILAPYYMCVNYDWAEHEGAEVNFKFDVNTRKAEVYIPYNYGEVVIHGNDVDGTPIEIPVVIENGKGVAQFTSSANQKLYTVNIIVSEMSSETGCSAYAYAYNGKTYDYISVDMDAAVSNEATITVPYGTITDADGNNDNKLELHVSPYSYDATVDAPAGEDSGYVPKLKDNGDGTYTSTFTVTAQNGDKQTYTVTIVEDKGDRINDVNLYVEYREAFADDGYADMYSTDIDLEQAKTEEGCTVTIPYGANEYRGIYISSLDTFCKLEGINKRYYLDKDGKATAVVKATSPDGKHTETYTIHMVKDKVGDAAELKNITMEWEDWDYESFYNDVDLEKAATPEGAVVAFPGRAFEDSSEILGWSNIRVSGTSLQRIDVEVVYESGDTDVFKAVSSLYEVLGFNYQGIADIRITVTSENTKVKKVYRFKVINADDVCSHNYVASETPATCLDAGKITYTCDICGDSYSEAIPALNHALIPHAAKPATCKETGWDAYETCSRCDYTTYQEIAAIEHTYKAEITEPTCLEKGYTTYTCACGDSYVADYTAATDHPNRQTIKGKPATCTETGLTDTEMCLDCDLILEPQKVIEALGHTAGPDADCTTAQTCATCGVTLNEPIGHNYKTVVIAPTCTEGGYTTYTCACGDSYVADEVAAKGHSKWPTIFGGYAATCTKPGYTASYFCNDCETYLKSSVMIPATGHDWETTYTVDKAATNKAAGSKSKHCATCDIVKTGSKVTIAKIKSTTAATLVYNGKVRNQNVTVVNANGKKLVKGTDFTVTYKNAKGTKVATPKVVGTYTAVVKFKGAYSGTVIKTFQINPKGTTINKLTKPAKKQIKVTWKKQAVQTTGYQIRYGTKQNLNLKGSKTVTIAKKGTTTRTIKQLKAKKKYWVQIRTYKTVNGKKYYSAWSAKKVITTK